MLWRVKRSEPARPGGVPVAAQTDNVPRKQSGRYHRQYLRSLRTRYSSGTAPAGFEFRRELRLERARQPALPLGIIAAGGSGFEALSGLNRVK